MNTQRWVSLFLLAICAIAGTQAVSAKVRNFMLSDSLPKTGATALSNGDSSPPPATTPPPATPPPVSGKPTPPKKPPLPPSVIGTPPPPVLGGK